MDWYCALLSSFKDDGGSSVRLWGELEKRILDLYEALLSYLLKSVCSYYRNRFLNLLQDSIKLNDWDGNFTAIQNAEDAVLKDLEVYNNLQIKSQLNNLVDIAKNKEMKVLQNIYQTLQQQYLEQLTEKEQQCLRDLRVTNPRDDMTRIEGIKGGLLEDSYVWILRHKDFIHWRDEYETRLLWIKGDPGKGKTMLLIGIVKELQKAISTPDSGLLSYFFCQGTDSRLNNATAVLRGLIYQLLDQQLSLVSYLHKEYDNAGRSLFEDLNAFVVLSKTFTEMLEDPHLTRVYLILDALDECESGLEELIALIVRNASTSSSRVKWLVSSRNRHDIEERLRINDCPAELSLELNAKSVSGAVDVYINHKVSELAEMKRYDAMLQNQVRDQLHQKANETFLWVALVCKKLRDVKKWDVLDVLQEFPSDLTQLYAGMLDQIRRLTGQSATFCMQVLSTSTLAYRPFHWLELSALAALPENIALDDLTEIIHMCGSFLTIREETIYFIHQSAKDYLSTKVDHLIFPSGRTEVHRGIVSQSLQGMSKLQRDMYNLRDPGILIDQVTPANPDPLTRIRYACVYWIDHLCEIDNSFHDKVGLRDDGEIYRFLNEHFLHWLEALSLMRHMTSGVVMIRKLENLLAECIDGSRLLDLVRDELRFILHNRWVIENVPLQAYASALVFSPVRSLTREQWKQEDPKWILTKPIMESNWNSCLQTLVGHGSSVRSVAFSHDSRQLASGSDDETVKIWDAGTGECVQTLAGHGGLVRSVAFSHDSRQLASGSVDETVKIWDAGTGECVQTLDIGITVSQLKFNHNGSCLFTEVGTITLARSSPAREISRESGDTTVSATAAAPTSVASVQEWQCCGYGLSSDRSWITWQGRHVLYLPIEYRPLSVAVLGYSMALGCSSGRVLVIGFSRTVSPFGNMIKYREDE